MTRGTTRAARPSRVSSSLPHFGAEAPLTFWSSAVRVVPAGQMRWLSLVSGHSEVDHTPPPLAGGATGAGIALDAQTRGLRTALVEAEDFASGTSSRSTKLLHGGVRYLEKAFWQASSRYSSPLPRGAFRPAARAPSLTPPVPVSPLSSRLTWAS